MIVIGFAAVLFVVVIYGTGLALCAHLALRVAKKHGRTSVRYQLLISVVAACAGAPVGCVILHVPGSLGEGQPRVVDDIALAYTIPWLIVMFVSLLLAGRSPSRGPSSDVDKT